MLTMILFDMYLQRIGCSLGETQAQTPSGRCQRHTCCSQKTMKGQTRSDMFLDGIEGILQQWLPLTVSGMSRAHKGCNRTAMSAPNLFGMYRPCIGCNWSGPLLIDMSPPQTNCRTRLLLQC